MMTTVLLADGEPVFREGLAELLATQRDFIVVGEASDTREAVEEARARRPDLALLALDLPGGGGLATAGRIRRISPGTRLIVLVPPRRDEDALEPRAEVDGVVCYGGRADQVLAGIRRVAQDEPAEPYGPPPEALRPSTFRAAPRLTPREEEVFALVARAWTNRQIQTALGIRQTTVKRHVRHILRKLHVHNRIEAAIYAARASGWAPEGGSEP